MCTLHHLPPPRTLVATPVLRLQNFGLSEGIPGSRYWKGMRARAELLNYLEDLCRGTIEGYNADPDGAQDSVIVRFLKALEAEDADLASDDVRLCPSSGRARLFGLLCRGHAARLPLCPLPVR